MPECSMVTKHSCVLDTSCALLFLYSFDLSILHLHERKPKLPVDMEFEKPAEDDDNHLNTSWVPEEII